MLVYAVRVGTRNIFYDMWAKIKNIFGGRLTPYEQVISKCIKEAYDELKSKYPSVRNIRIQTTMITLGAAEIIVYGEVDEKESN